MMMNFHLIIFMNKIIISKVKSNAGKASVTFVNASEESDKSKVIVPLL